MVFVKMVPKWGIRHFNTHIYFTLTHCSRRSTVSISALVHQPPLVNIKGVVHFVWAISLTSNIVQIQEFSSAQVRPGSASDITGYKPLI